MIEQKVGFRGKIKVEHFSEDGKLLGTYENHNDITNPGKNNLLDEYFRNQAQTAAWYIGLIDNASYSAVAAADTMASHAGWIESTAYDEATRPAWGPAAAASQSISNTSVVVFTINATGTMRGVFITSSSTKSGTTGVMWSTALFPSTVPVNSGDQFKITYTVNC